MWLLKFYFIRDMKAKKLNQEKIAAIVQEAKEVGIAKTARKFGMAERGIHLILKYLAEFDKLGVDYADCFEYLKLKEENLRLKKLVSEKELEIEINSLLIKNIKQQEEIINLIKQKRQK